MERKPVESSNIRAIGYHEESETLEIEFLNGAVYQYFDVPVEIYEGLMGADSHGSYLARHIKGKFRYSKV